MYILIIVLVFPSCNKEAQKEKEKKDGAFLVGSSLVTIASCQKCDKVIDDIRTTASRSLKTPPISRSALVCSWRLHLANIETAINDRRDGSDFCAQLLFNTSKIVPIIVSYQVDSESQMTKTSRTTNSVKVGLAVLWEIKIDHHVD